MSEAIGTKRGSITRAQGRTLGHQFARALDSLDESEAAWAMENFGKICTFMLRRPENSLHIRRFPWAFEVVSVDPSKLQRPEDPGNLKGPYWVDTHDHRAAVAPASYEGSPNVQFQMCAFASGPPYVEGDSLPYGLLRVGRALRLFGHPPADLHQAVAFASEMTRLKTAEEWISSYGPCRILVLGSRVREERYACPDMVPVLYSPGHHDSSADPRGEVHWRLDCVRFDASRFDSLDDWSLTATPA